jgi:NAD(P)-dependent dehydrogenase (short-subunit alcohol dehydrogenase family)
VHADGLGVDVLVNNAGGMAPPRRLSPQGHESQFAGNHLGHFALAGLLLDLLQAGSDPRVVTVTSIGHHGGRIHFDDLTGARTYAPVTYYDQSKFANVLFALELDRRLRAAGSPVRSLLAHPGVSATNLQSTGPTGVIRVGGAVVKHLFAQDVERGVLPQLYAATAPNLRSGQFFGPDGWRELRGYPTTVRPDPAAEDTDTARRLWQLSEDLTGVRYAIATPA